MGRFLNSLNVTELDDVNFKIVDHPLLYLSDLIGIITVPVGFKTDFASVPRIGMVYAVLGDTAHEPAVVHDWLYYSEITTREEADNILLEAMKAWGMSMWRYYPIYWGVRMGGWVAWDAHRKAGHKAADFGQ